MRDALRDSDRRPSRLVATALAFSLLATLACRPREAPTEPPASPTLPAVGSPAQPANRKLDWPEADADRLRSEALRRAKVWRAPTIPVHEADLAANPAGPGSFSPSDELSCRFLLKDSQGLTPKFSCVLPSGEVAKVKYGRRNAEVFAETAATRLVRALGFGADLVSVVKSVRCLDCPAFPYPRLKILDAITMDEGRATVFEMATIERPLPGLEIEAPTAQGWSFAELDQISEREGGATRAEVDALRLLAVFLAHWDNKATNQSLVCLPGQESQKPPGCRGPFAFMQDLGKSFGPYHIDLAHWRDGSVWADRTGCRVSMKALPFEGATFPDVQITEDGRRLLASLLGDLSDEQLHSLFTAARFPQFTAQDAAGKDPAAWVAAFRSRFRQIEGRTCP